MHEWIQAKQRLGTGRKMIHKRQAARTLAWFKSRRPLALCGVAGVLLFCWVSAMALPALAQRGGHGTPPGRLSEPASSVPRVPKTKPTAKAAVPSTPLSDIHGEPIVKVRIASNEAEIKLTAAEGRVRLGPPAVLNAGMVSRDLSSPVTIRHTAQGYHIQAGDGLVMVWQLPVLEVMSIKSDGKLGLNGKQYPGDMWLHFKKNADGRLAGVLDVINHVPLESYIPGVIQKELYASWDLQAFRAQAIAARSYYFYEAHKNAGRYYDLESTTASQVYTGQVVNPKAAQAARTTRGMVMAFDGFVLPTFYSSTSGGIGQDAYGTFPGMPDLAPLRGFDQGAWGQISNRYSWVSTRSTEQLARRLAAWGQRNQKPIGMMQGLTNIRTKTTNRAGRPKTFEVVDARGQKYELSAEQMRIASNASAPGLPDVTRENMLYSAYVTVTVTQAHTRFDGRGFGHGVGMCQWSAQAMALAGHQGEAIVSFFYPGAVLRRVY